MSKNTTTVEEVKTFPASVLNDLPEDFSVEEFDAWLADLDARTEYGTVLIYSEHS
jgi:hypothetical protein